MADPPNKESRLKTIRKLKNLSNFKSFRFATFNKHGRNRKDQFHDYSGHLDLADPKSTATRSLTIYRKEAIGIQKDETASAS